MKYSKKFERDFAFYQRHIDKFTFCGQPLIQARCDIVLKMKGIGSARVDDAGHLISATVKGDAFYAGDEGVDAKRAFFKWDTQGVLVPTCQPITLQNIINCKKSINFQIGQWADGFNDCGIPVESYLAEFQEPPAWVESALRGAIKKRKGVIC